MVPAGILCLPNWDLINGRRRRRKVTIRERETEREEEEEEEVLLTAYNK